MPNVCMNKLVVSGVGEELSEFLSVVEGGFSFGVFVPEPEFVDGDDWVGWRNEFWGTKWDAENVVVSEVVPGEVFEFEFDTAWGPPEFVVREMQRQFPGLSISLVFEEPNLGFGGMVFDSGEVFFEDLEWVA